ncbi:hypothetical protein DTO271G3_6869 [Paecilomyces variotii]|nr:hypothetical protein DTO271G3_6869 [Paecilomyces variotii]
MALSRDEFEKAIDSAISTKEHIYSHFYAFHFHWEDDNTNAERDANSFSDLAQLLGFPVPETYVIPSDSHIPGFEIQERITAMLKRAMCATGKRIMIIHYAGHGGENNLDELSFYNSTGKKSMAANSFLLNILTASLVPFNESIDIIVMLDCCYSFLASRDIDKNKRLVEFLCANDTRDPIAFSAGSKNSFTSKLLIEVRSRAQRGEKFVEMTDAITSLQQLSPVKQPIYAAKLGIGSILLPLNKSPAANAHHSLSTPAPGLMATFSMHVSHNYTREELKEFTRWLRESPKAKTSSLKLESVKITNSMVFIFEIERKCFRRIEGLEGVSLICDNQAANFDWLFDDLSPSGHFSELTKENRPFADGKGC